VVVVKASLLHLVLADGTKVSLYGGDFVAHLWDIFLLQSP
jgi:hypothetical protein